MRRANTISIEYRQGFGSNLTRGYDMTLKLTHFPAGKNGFFRAPVLIEGATEIVLIDGGFSYPDGKAVASAIEATGKRLTTIYISQSDPDYYFGLPPIAKAFPDARVVAASATLVAIEANVEKKLAVWGPQLKENGPQRLADLVLPDAFDGSSITVDGEIVEIVTVTGISNRRYLWVPALQAVVGGVMIFSGVHVWTADTPTPAIRATWQRELAAIAARHPAIVIPGHMAVGAATDASAIAYTSAYLAAFDAELATSADSAALIDAMTARYPTADMQVAIQIGAKVATNEMPWG
jgi:glyoxylase-like metal-dependent hydrolase (beta-lactamase superfamily II)